MSLPPRKLPASFNEEIAMMPTDDHSVSSFLFYERLRQLAIDGALVLGLVLLLAAEMP